MARYGGAVLVRFGSVRLGRARNGLAVTERRGRRGQVWHGPARRSNLRSIKNETN